MWFSRSTAGRSRWPENLRYCEGSQGVIRGPRSGLARDAPHPVEARQTHHAVGRHSLQLHRHPLHAAHHAVGLEQADVKVLGREARSEEHTSELQSHSDLVCRLLLEKKKKKHKNSTQVEHTTLHVPYK